MTTVHKMIPRLFLFGLLSFCCISFSGCAQALFMPFYLLRGMDVDPEFKDEVKAIPKESKMVVICRSQLNLFGEDNPSADLSRSITFLLSEKIKDKKKKKLEWIPFDRVEEMFDESTFNLESYAKMGKKLGADYVIGVDIDSFETHHSSQFYQGQAKVHVRLIKVETGEDIVRKSVPTYIYPPTPVPISDSNEIEFQKKFTVKLANEIGCLFYPHDPHDKYAQDNDFSFR